jgi:DNA-nicking Smr family endonuclease
MQTAMKSGIIEIDLHGLNKYQAKQLIDHHLLQTGRSVYRLKLIHGFHSGVELKSMIRSVYKNNPKVIRIEYGLNQGETDLVLRELF